MVGKPEDAKRCPVTPAHQSPRQVELCVFFENIST
jgi:hypothetical protein